MLNWLCAKIITLVLWLPVYVEQITWGMSFRWVKKISIFRIVIYQPVTYRTLSSQEASFLDCEVFSCSVSLKCSCIRSLQVQTIASGCFYPSRSLCLIFIKFVKSHTLRQQAKIALSRYFLNLNSHKNSRNVRSHDHKPGVSAVVRKYNFYSMRAKNVSIGRFNARFNQITL